MSFTSVEPESEVRDNVDVSRSAFLASLTVPERRFKLTNENMLFVRSRLRRTPRLMRCDACGNAGLSPMLITPVWLIVAHDHPEHRLCLGCVLRRLGRPLTDRDIRACGWNSWYPRMTVTIDRRDLV